MSGGPSQFILPRPGWGRALGWGWQGRDRNPRLLSPGHRLSLRLWVLSEPAAFPRALLQTHPDKECHQAPQDGEEPDFSAACEARTLPAVPLESPMGMTRSGRCSLLGLPQASLLHPCPGFTANLPGDPMAPESMCCIPDISPGAHPSRSPAQVQRQRGPCSPTGDSQRQRFSFTVENDLRNSSLVFLQSAGDKGSNSKRNT